MSAWPRVKLRELLKLDLQKEAVDASKSYEMVGVLSFGRGLFKRPSIESGATSYKHFLRLKADHVVMSQLFGWEGALALSSEELSGCYVSPQFPTFLCNEDRLNRFFLGWVMRQPSFWEELGSRTRGMGDRRRTLNPDALFESEIPLPPLAEQQAIVSRLDTLADKVRQVNERLDAIEQTAAALFLSLHYKLSGDRVRRLGDVVELHEEPVPVRADSEYPQVGVRGFGGGLFPKATVGGTETSYRAFNRLYVDALVLSQVKGWEGALALCPAELAGMYVSPEYRTFRCVSGEATPAYIGELVRTPWFWSLLQDATRGVGARRERTRPEQFLNIELPMPPENMQRKVVEILDRQSRLRSRHATIRQANDALIPATLERLFSGAR